LLTAVRLHVGLAGMQWGLKGHFGAGFGIHGADANTVADSRILNKNFAASGSVMGNECM